MFLGHGGVPIRTLAVHHCQPVAAQALFSSIQGVYMLASMLWWVLAVVKPRAPKHRNEGLDDAS